MPSSNSRIVVFHTGYGCDTGCCGHIVELSNEERFVFDHPYKESDRDFVKRIVTEEWGQDHVADIDWENVIVSHD